jgi:hypothetical protein
MNTDVKNTRSFEVSMPKIRRNTIIKAKDST